MGDKNKFDDLDIKDSIPDLGVRDKLPDEEGSAAYDPVTDEWVGPNGLRYKIKDEIIPQDIKP